MRKDPKQTVSVVGTGLVIFSHPLRVELEGKKEKTASRTGRVGNKEEFKATWWGRKHGVLYVFEGGSLAGGLANTQRVLWVVEAEDRGARCLEEQDTNPLKSLRNKNTLSGSLGKSNLFANQEGELLESRSSSFLRVFLESSYFPTCVGLDWLLKWMQTIGEQKEKWRTELKLNGIVNGKNSCSEGWYQME